jgi:hypothetical protein
MMRLVDTTYGLSDEALDARAGAIAINAYMAQLRALNRHELPILDVDYRKIEMLKRVLTSANAVDAASAEGAMFSPVQAKVTKKFSQIESGLAAALDLIDDTPAEEIVKAVATKKSAAAA